MVKEYLTFKGGDAKKDESMWVAQGLRWKQAVLAFAVLAAFVGLAGLLLWCEIGYSHRK